MRYPDYEIPCLGDLVAAQSCADDEPRETTVHRRFQVCDPQITESIDDVGDSRRAKWIAEREAKARGGPIEIYDVMARRGRPELWSVDGDGSVTVLRTREPRR